MQTLLPLTESLSTDPRDSSKSLVHVIFNETKGEKYKPDMKCYIKSNSHSKDIPFAPNPIWGLEYFVKMSEMCSAM